MKKIRNLIVALILALLPVLVAQPHAEADEPEQGTYTPGYLVKGDNPNSANIYFMTNLEGLPQQGNCVIRRSMIHTFMQVEKPDHTFILAGGNPDYCGWIGVNMPWVVQDQRFDFWIKPDDWLGYHGYQYYPPDGWDLYVNLPQQLAGDSVNSNLVDIGDFTAMHNSFGKGYGDPEYNAHCDYDRSGQVNIYDYNLFYHNFNVEGDDPLVAWP